MMKTIGKYFGPLLFALFGPGFMIHAIIRDPSSWSLSVILGTICIVCGYCFATLRDDILLPPPLRGHLEITETTWKYKPPRFLKFLSTFIVIPFGLACVIYITPNLRKGLQSIVTQGPGSSGLKGITLGPWDWFWLAIVAVMLYGWILSLRRFFSKDSGLVRYTPEKFTATTRNIQAFNLVNLVKSDFMFRLQSSRGMNLRWILYVGDLCI